MCTLKFAKSIISAWKSRQWKPLGKCKYRKTTLRWWTKDICDRWGFGFPAKGVLCTSKNKEKISKFQKNEPQFVIDDYQDQEPKYFLLTHRIPKGDGQWRWFFNCLQLIYSHSSGVNLVRLKEKKFGGDPLISHLSLFVICASFWDRDFENF